MTPPPASASLRCGYAPASVKVAPPLPSWLLSVSVCFLGRTGEDVLQGPSTLGRLQQASLLHQCLELQNDMKMIGRYKALGAWARFGPLPFLEIFDLLRKCYKRLQKLAPEVS